MVQKLVPGVNRLPAAFALLPTLRGQGDLRHARRDRLADLRAGGVQVRLRLAHVGPLPDQAWRAG